MRVGRLAKVSRRVSAKRHRCRHGSVGKYIFHDDVSTLFVRSVPRAKYKGGGSDAYHAKYSHFPVGPADLEAFSRWPQDVV
eukprot:6030988-Lingulodinium_polyedra.AAC.1